MIEMKIDDWINKIHNGHVIDILNEMPSNNVNVVVTSPPYWGLRDYGEGNNIIWGEKNDCEHKWGERLEKSMSGGLKSKKVKIKGKDNFQIFNSYSNFCNKCGAWKGQLGLEPHPQEYINHLVEIFNKMKRILKEDGLLFLNIGDTYYGSGKGIGGKIENSKEVYQLPKESKPKYDYDGRWLQAKQLMLIPSRVAIALQESGWILRNDIIWHKPNHMPASVRDRLSKSYEHVFMFVKNKKYYFNLDKIRVPHIWAKKDKRSKLRRVKGKSGKITTGKYATNAVGYNPKGKNPSDVWSINTKPCKEAHFATYPTTLIERILKCSCPKDGIVMDTFIGSGTTGLVAKQLGLNFIGIELNKEYCKIASKRIGDVPIIEFKKKYKVSKVEEPKVDWKKVFDV